MAWYSHLSWLSCPVVDDSLDLRLELPLEQVHACVARLFGVVDARQRRRLLPRRRRCPFAASSCSARRREQVSGHYPSPSIQSTYYCTCLGPQIALVTYILRLYLQTPVSQRVDHIFTSD